MNASKTAACFLLAVGGLALLGGCDKLTRSRFEMIDVGSAQAYDVEQTIGEPSDRMAHLWHYERVDKHLNVLIHYDEGGTVCRKEWHDVQNNDHYDSAEPPPPDSDTRESVEVRHIK